MEIDYIIKKLKEQQEKAWKSDLEVWLSTCYSLIEEFFTNTASRTVNFQKIIFDYDGKKAKGFANIYYTDTYKKAIEYIKETIQYLEEQKVRHQREAKRKQEEAAKVVDKEETRTEPGTNAPLPIIVTSPPIIKKQLPFGISAATFWTIFIAFVSGAFILGLYFGNFKFDKDKSDYYDQIKHLREDTVDLNKKIVIIESVVKQKDSIIIAKQDSLILLNKNLTNLYLLFAKQSK